MSGKSTPLLLCQETGASVEVDKTETKEPRQADLVQKTLYSVRENAKEHVGVLQDSCS